ncbi:hypothetical protein B0A67_23705 [Flavobacterium aquidurense]|jgi:hypothetical protein|uniref:hypothetical protein n=1 Tax=Flavobacterium aquidurense TaxID=362413 RepID=UPI000914727E|nr:hypothetical protein [Flavobacterium aquidurense]OXA66269.1 hypothetical protein B0A67_23705 [Flavobacterium aquidurense]SHH76668.1 hypothetical protein SAMN05444481_1279 [Flavobacterium frigidimaris]
MKSILPFIIIVLLSAKSFSQSPKDSFRNAVKERLKNINEKQIDNPYYSRQELEEEYLLENSVFQALAQPSTESDLANYFKIYLEQNLLKKIDFSKLKTSSYYKGISNKKYNYTIRLTFEINKKNKAFNFRIHTGDSELDKKVIEIFKNYPLEKLNLNDNAKLGKISIQLFTKEDKNTIIKASTFAVVDQLPVLKGCEGIAYNSELGRCLYDQIFEYVLKNISLENIAKQGKRGEIIINPRFSIDSDGKIFRVNSIAPNKIIKDEIDRIITSFNQVIIPGKRNDTPKNTYCETFRMITINNLK